MSAVDPSLRVREVPLACTAFRAGAAHQIKLLASRLDEQQRRWFVALEAMRVGRGGQRLLAQVTGMDHRAIERGCRKLLGWAEGASL